MVLVMRDALESLRASVIATTLHHGCKTLAKDARRAEEELTNKGTAALTSDLAETWLEHQPLSLPGSILPQEVSELVAHSNEYLGSIQSVVGLPVAPPERAEAAGRDDPALQEILQLFRQLWTNSTRLVGMTRLRSMRVMADLEQLIERAALDESQATPATPIPMDLQLPRIGAQQHQASMERDVLAADNAKASAAMDEASNVTRISEVVADQAAEGAAGRELGLSLNKPIKEKKGIALLRDTMHPERSNDEKEPPDGSAA